MSAKQCECEVCTATSMPVCVALEKLGEANAETDKWRRIRKNTHGNCCQCQRCGVDYDNCRCDLDEVCNELAESNKNMHDAGMQASEMVMDLQKQLSTADERITFLFEQNRAQSNEIKQLEDIRIHSAKRIPELRMALENLMIHSSRDIHTNCGVANSDGVLACPYCRAESALKD